MMDVVEPLDFELEDSLLINPVVSNKRKKLMGLGELLTEHYKEQSKLIENEAKKQAKAQKSYDSDEDKNCKEAILATISSGEEMFEWGLCVFGQQKATPPLSFPELGSWSILQSFMNNGLNSLVGLTSEQECPFLEGLLKNGWLLRLILKCGRVEKTIAMWTFSLMLYSSKEELRPSACEFWCAILSSKIQIGARPIEIDWLPNFSELKSALEIYGFLFNSSSSMSAENSSGCKGPPQNIITWIKFTAVYCRLRCKQSVLLTSDCQELAEVIICLFLDRQLQGLSVLLRDCIQSVISSFTDEEWINSYSRIAKSIASRVPMNLNCLRAVQCLSGVDPRTKHLKSVVAFEILVNCFDTKVANEEGILTLLISINVKEKACDFFKLYIYVILTENWLRYDERFSEKPVIREMWGLFLRNCSCQISSTDLRPHASKVRNKAAYLLQDIGSS
ncbi:putative Shugoshin C terminus [Hibiscus syriacus]|uniref:Shugoshin C terminus n=1 Tax=Hibiscus syriacus TaxID=106335 RepID=A0A6A3C3Z8_HIBSY|nr:putative Shugoshin C terminus [Hibiscus syriacus]